MPAPGKPSMPGSIAGGKSMNPRKPGPDYGLTPFPDPLFENFGPLASRNIDSGMEKRLATPGNRKKIINNPHTGCGQETKR
jgi:hypothetical protein